MSHSLHIDLLAYILLLVVWDRNLSQNGIGWCSSAFISRYAGVWPKVAWSRWCCRSGSIYHLQFHIRFFSKAKLHSVPRGFKGVLLFRKISVVAPIGREKFIENRAAIATNTTLESNPAKIFLVSLADYDIELSPSLEHNCAVKLSPNKRIIGITVFQMWVMQLLREANSHWDVFLRLVDEVMQEVGFISKRGAKPFRPR